VHLSDGCFRDAGILIGGHVEHDEDLLSEAVNPNAAAQKLWNPGHIAHVLDADQFVSIGKGFPGPMLP
jgi:hypothetical protein